jgi:hypothetical protein
MRSRRVTPRPSSPSSKRCLRGGATVHRPIATLSHVVSFAAKERRLIDRNPVGDIRRKKESRGRTRFLSDAERNALLAPRRRSQGEGDREDGGGEGAVRARSAFV